MRLIDRIESEFKELIKKADDEKHCSTLTLLDVALAIFEKNYNSTEYQDKLKKLFPSRNIEGRVHPNLKMKISVSFEDCEEVENGMLSSISGGGNTYEEACESLYNRIKGKTLRFYNKDGTKEEVKIIVMD